MTPTAVPATSAPAALPGLAATSRPDPPGAWAASVAFGWRALLKIRHVPEMLLDVIAIPVVFIYLLGGALAGSPLTLASNVFVARTPCPAGCRPSCASTRSPTWSLPNAP